jgi:hypothetical protein
MPSRNSQQSRIIVIGVSAFVAFMVLITVVFVLTRSSASGKFKGQIEGYLAINKEQMDQGPYLKGKMVVISKRDKEVDEEVSSGLPPELQAAGPEEVGTIVILNWRGDVRGPYVGSSAFGMRHKCELSVIDRSLGAIIGRQDFYGGDPPAVVSANARGDIYGSKPIDQIVAYLTQLPRESGAEVAPIKDWMVVFRSSDPAVWNTDSPGDKFAVPLRRVPASIRFLRIKRMDTGATLIVPIKQQQLLREEKPEPAEGCWWNGTAADGWGGRHLGLVQVPPQPISEKPTIRVSNHDFFSGSGFGHKTHINDRQYCCWQGQEIPQTTFEIAVTPNALTAEEKRSLMSYDADEGPAPKGWTVLMRSDDPSVWNTDSPGRQFAIPVCRAHSKVSHLRLKRIDTGDTLIVPITRNQLARPANSPQDKQVLWNGSARKEYGGYHLGLIQKPSMRWHEVISVMNDGAGSYAGSGFGHKLGVDKDQYYCWQGAEIPKTAFEVAVSADPLTEEEKRFVASPVDLRKPLDRHPPGTPVAGAIAQPEPPATAPGKKTVDLIALVDQTKDVVRGDWLVVGKTLHANNYGGVLRMQIPYQPPEEYDFVVTFSQPRLRNGISLIMPNPNGGSFFWAFGYEDGQKFSFHGMNMKEGSLSKAIAANKAYTTVVQVRRDGVKALLDGKVIAEQKTDFRDLNADHYREIPDTRLLAVACDDPTVYHYVRVVEITGTGKRIR